MVSRARSRTAHCFGVRFRVSSRTMWSWSPRESNNIRTACGCHEGPPFVSPQLHASLLLLLFSLQSSDFPPPRQPLPFPSGCRRTPCIQSTLSLESWLSSLAAVKISWCPGQGENHSTRELQTPSGSRELGKGDTAGGTGKELSLPSGQ